MPGGRKRKNILRYKSFLQAILNFSQKLKMYIKVGGPIILKSLSIPHNPFPRFLSVHPNTIAFVERFSPLLIPYDKLNVNVKPTLIT